MTTKNKHIAIKLELIDKKIADEQRKGNRSSSLAEARQLIEDIKWILQ